MTTIEAEPAVAGALFGDRVEVAREFAAHLVEYGETLGLLGPLELERLWSRHLVNCVLVAPLLWPGRVGDIGSGAGLPGIVLAIARPDVRLVLIEPMERRATLGPDGYWHVRGVALPLAGRWHMQIDALVTDFQKVTLEDDLQIR